MWSVSGSIQDEGKTVDSPEQLTVTMLFIVFTQLIKVRNPKCLVRLGLVLNRETNLVELSFPLNIHFTILEECALFIDLTAQFWVLLVPVWHFTCKSGRKTCGVLVRVFKDESKTVHSP
jgi:hypothetical protein